MGSVQSLFGSAPVRWKDVKPADIAAITPERTNIPFDELRNVKVVDELLDQMDKITKAVAKFVQESFGSKDLVGSYSPWVESYTPEFYTYVLSVAREDRYEGGWDNILRDHRTRIVLVVGIIMKMLSTEVFDVLLFGANAEQQQTLSNLDELFVPTEGKAPRLSLSLSDI
jgi:hypothetical protein